MEFEIESSYDADLYNAAERLVNQVIARVPETSKAVVAVDVSGGFNKDDLERRLSVITLLLTRYRKISHVQVVTFDHQIESNETFENGNVNFILSPKCFNGGTSSECVFELFQGDTPAIFFITDGYIYNKNAGQQLKNRIGWFLSDQRNVEHLFGATECCESTFI